MKRLTLMRHGDAQWRDRETADFARPLNRRGIAEVEAMARRLVELELVPDLLVTSSARRTQQTGDIIARELGLPARYVRHEECLYLATPEDILHIVRTIGPRVPHLMVIGHNPGISDLARYLAPDPSVHALGTAAICSLTLAAAHWSDIRPDAVIGVLSEAPPAGLFSGLWA